MRKFIMKADQKQNKISCSSYQTSGKQKEKKKYYSKKKHAMFKVFYRDVIGIQNTKIYYFL